MSNLLTRDDLVAKSKSTIRKFEVGGKTCFVKSVPVRIILECNSLPEEKQSSSLALQCLCTESGERLLTDDDGAILEEMHDLSVLSEIYDACKTVNGLNKKGFEEVAKN